MKACPFVMSGSFCPKGFSFSASSNFHCSGSTRRHSCFPALNTPPSRILVRLHLIGTQNQLKKWKKMHKLLITWTGWWNSKRRPHQPAPDKKATFPALLMLCEGMWTGPMPGSQLQFTCGFPLVSGADSHHWNVCHEECPPGRRLCTSPSLLQGWNVQCEKPCMDTL